MGAGTGENTEKSFTTNTKEDHTLLHNFIAGDNNSFSEIYKKYVNELFAYGLGLSFDKEILKDAIQDVFYKFYESKKHLKNVSNLKYYLFRMLKNHLLDIYRSQIYFGDINTLELTFSIKTTVLDEMITEEEKLALQTKIDHLLLTLTDRQREAIYLRFIQEMEYEEIGKLLDMAPQASRKLVSRAIKRMRDEKMPFLLYLTWVPLSGF